MSWLPSGWDLTRRTGSVALRVEEHSVDGAAEGPPVPGLRVRDLESGAVAGYRPGSALYGFVGLPPGARRLLIDDPSDRYVPRVLRVSVQEAPEILRTTVRPGIGCPIPRGQLVLWGDVVDAAGEPAPYALIRLAHASGVTWTTTTDATGRYLVWARGLPARDPEEGAWPLLLTLRGRAGASGPEALPDDLDAMSATEQDAWFDLGLEPVALLAHQSTRTRVPTLSLP